MGFTILHLGQRGSYVLHDLGIGPDPTRDAEIAKKIIPQKDFEHLLLAFRLVEDILHLRTMLQRVCIPNGCGQIKMQWGVVRLIEVFLLVDFINHIIEKFP